METYNFFGVSIAATNISDVKDHILAYDFSVPAYISFPDTYVIALCQENKALKSILNEAYLALPDGKPSVLYGKKMGLKQLDTVSGYWLCKSLLETNLSHFFLGSTPERLEKMIQIVKSDHPNANVLGHFAPPFISEQRAQLGVVLKDEFEAINALKPDLIWIGMSSPKQDYIMYNHLTMLGHGVMLGIGGVFDYLSGEVHKSPEWVKKAGLRWVWRLANEPVRLWAKYFFVFKTMSWKYIHAYYTVKKSL